MSAMFRVRPDVLQALTGAILRAAGVDAVQAADVADNLVWHELVGRPNFGLLRLPLYVARVHAGGLRTPCTPRFVAETGAVAVLDGDGGFGQHVMRLACDRAAELAEAHGIGTVAVRNSNFFGSGAFFAARLADRGQASMVMSNAFPKVAPHGGTKPALGTNPFAFGAPRADGRHVLFDMATSAVAGSTVREAELAGAALPDGAAVDADGRVTSDPSVVAALLPAGGAKGFGMALMVETLTGVLAGATVASGVKSMYRDVGEPGGNGHVVMALNVEAFGAMGDFDARFDALADDVRAGGDAVRLPGEVRWDTLRDNTTAGVPLHDATLVAIARACEATGVEADLAPAA